MFMNICPLLTSQIYQAKIKYKNGGSYLYKNQKCRLLEIEKKNHYFILEIPYFSYAFFQKMLNVSLEHSFNATFREHGELHFAKYG